MKIEEDDIGADVRAAMNSAIAEPVDNSPEVDAAADVKSEVKSDRDEMGRFKPKQGEEPGKSIVTSAEEIVSGKTPPTGSEPEGQETHLSTDKPPSAWSPVNREKWATLDPDLKAEIIRREESSLAGVRQLQDRYSSAEQFLTTLNPIFSEASKLGANPAEYIMSTMQTEQFLRNAPMPDKFQTLLQIADNYGIPLRKIIDESIGQKMFDTQPAQPQYAQVAPEIQQQLEEIRSWRQQQEIAQVDQAIEAFAAQAEFFQDVRDQMAELMDRGLTDSLEDAYERSIWANPQIRQVLLARQGQTQQSNQIAQRQKVAAGTSIPSSGKLNVATGADADDSLEDTIRKAFGASKGRL
jgi:hypothetical protein